MSECGTAQLSLSLFLLYRVQRANSSRYVAFVELIHLNNLLDSVTFSLLTNHRPRKCDKTYIERHILTLWRPGSGCKNCDWLQCSITPHHCHIKSLTNSYRDALNPLVTQERMNFHHKLLLFPVPTSELWWPNISTCSSSHQHFSEIYLYRGNNNTSCSIL